MHRPAILAPNSVAATAHSALLIPPVAAAAAVVVAAVAAAAAAAVVVAVAVHSPGHIKAKATGNTRYNVSFFTLLHILPIIPSLLPLLSCTSIPHGVGEYYF